MTLFPGIDCRTPLRSNERPMSIAQVQGAFHFLVEPTATGTEPGLVAYCSWMHSFNLIQALMFGTRTTPAGARRVLLASGADGNGHSAVPGRVLAAGGGGARPGRSGGSDAGVCRRYVWQCANAQHRRVRIPTTRQCSLFASTFHYFSS